MLTVLKTRFNEVKEKMSTLVHLELMGHDAVCRGKNVGLFTDLIDYTMLIIEV